VHISLSEVLQCSGRIIKIVNEILESLKQTEQNGIHKIAAASAKEHYLSPYSLENLIEGQNWFLNQFDEILQRYIILGFLSLSAKAGLNLPPFEISCSWLHCL
jgi:hypothetical protein